MRLVFTKGAGKSDRMEVFRPGRETERVDCPKQRIIPHDMVHYAVEKTMRARGFLERVRLGEAAGNRMEPAAESDSVERLVEVMQGDEWSGGSSSAADVIEMYRVTCFARQCPALPLDASVVEAIRFGISDLSTRWEAVPVGGALHLDFP